MLNDSERKIVYVPEVHGAYPISEIAKDTHRGTLIDSFHLEVAVTEEAAEEIITRVVSFLPENVQKYLDGIGLYGISIDYFIGSQAELIVNADAYVNYLIPIVYESGGDGTHFDEIPSAVEEFIFFCQQIKYLDPIQKLYDSLWQGPPVHLKEKPDVWGNDDDDGNWRPHNAYYPLDEDADDPALYSYFEIDGITLHTEHPKE